MSLTVFPDEQLSLLFDRDAYAEASVWLPEQALLEQWVLATLSHACPPVLSDDEQLRESTTIEVSLACVSAVEMQAINAEYRAKDRPTNVLSFPAEMPLMPSEAEDGFTLIMGDVIVCPEVLLQEADEQTKPLESHWAHMVVHSVLHLNGMDHEDENAAKIMETLEIQILSSLGITNPYIANSANKT